MKNPISPRFVVLCAFVAASGPAMAALTISESFDYPSSLGSGIAGGSGGTGFSGNWTNTDNDATISGTNTSLAYPPSSPLVSQGAHLALTSVDTSVTAVRNLSATMNLGTNGLVFYSSALVSVSTLGQTITVQFADGANNIRWNYGINSTGNAFVGVAPGSQTAAGTTVLTPGTTYLLVARFRTNTGSGGVDEVALSLFDASTPITEPATDLDWQVTSSGGSGVTLNRVNLVFNNPTGDPLRFDELKVGTTFLDVTGVVPEPGAAILCALAAAGSLARRRRR